METLTSILSGFGSGIGPFFILLGLLIFVHELGHFLVAKWCGVRVETFSLGFGKKIFSYKKGDTTYCISLIPLGGYVKMFGDDPTASLDSEQQKYSFLHKPVSQRIAIVLAGPLMNLFFAIFLFGAIGLVGEDIPSPILGDIKSDSKAHQVGFRSGDKILSINGKSILFWDDLQKFIEENPGNKLQFEILREFADKKEVLTATPDLVPNRNILSRTRSVGGIEGFGYDSFAAMVGVSNKDSLAGKAGLGPLEVITSVNSKPVRTQRELVQALKSVRAGDVLSIKSHGTGPGGDLPEKETSISIPASFGAIDQEKLGFENSELFLWRVEKKSPAERANFRAGDRILSINGESVKEWLDLQRLVKTYVPGGPELNFQIARAGESLDIKVAPEVRGFETDLSGKEEKRFVIGVSPALSLSAPETSLKRHVGLSETINYAMAKTWDWSEITVLSFVRMIEGEVSAKHIGGVISIGRVASRSFQDGLSSFLKVMAIISINLFILNLLPVPVLDGGHLLFFIVEALRRKPISLRKMEIAQQFGLIVLVTLMVFALFNDISNLFRSPW